MQVTTIGLDIAKNVFQVHGIDAVEKSSFGSNFDAARSWCFSRRCHLAFSAWKPAPRRIIGRVQLGHRVRLMPAKDEPVATAGLNFSARKLPARTTASIWSLKGAKRQSTRVASVSELAGFPKRWLAAL